jgi:hypothetical protein
MNFVSLLWKWLECVLFMIKLIIYNTFASLKLVVIF